MGLESKHTVHYEGSRYGGHTSAPGLLIVWEAATVQTVIAAAADRIEFYRTRDPEPELGEALGHLSAALEALRSLD